MNRPYISVRDVYKSYRLGRDNYVHALRGASLNVRKGEFLAIMGPSGSGKSTVVHIMGCLDVPDRGDVEIGGMLLHTLSRRAQNRFRNKEVGFVFQDFNLISTLTALENVALPARYAGVSRKKANCAASTILHDVGLENRIHHTPSQLSGGEQQRVAIARALVNGPQVVFADEPTGNLDSVSSDSILQLMRDINLKFKTTFVVVTHDDKIAKRCDRIVRMKDGVVS